VRISARAADEVPPGESVEISISDRGPGIASELLPALFDTFNDLDEVSATKYGGAGLGLPLAQKLCALMQAQLAIDTAPGAGTTVRIMLPLALAAPSRGDASQSEMPLSEAA